MNVTEIAAAFVLWARKGCTEGYTRARLADVDFDQVCVVLDLYPEIAVGVVREVLEDRDADVPTALPQPRTPPTAPQPRTPPTALVPFTPKTPRTIVPASATPKTPRTIVPMPATPMTAIPADEGEGEWWTEAASPYAGEWQEGGGEVVEAPSPLRPSSPLPGSDDFEALDAYEYEPDGWVIRWADRTTGPFNTAREAVEAAEQIACILDSAEAAADVEYDVLPLREAEGDDIEPFADHPVVVASEERRQAYIDAVEEYPEVVIGSKAPPPSAPRGPSRFDRFEGYTFDPDEPRSPEFERLYVPVLSEAVDTVKAGARGAKIAAKGVKAAYGAARAMRGVKKKIEDKVLDAAEGAVSAADKAASKVASATESLAYAGHFR